jgi:hypothetical protein
MNIWLICISDDNLEFIAVPKYGLMAREHISNTQFANCLDKYGKNYFCRSMGIMTVFKRCTVFIACIDMTRWQWRTSFVLDYVEMIPVVWISSGILSFAKILMIHSKSSVCVSFSPFSLLLVWLSLDLCHFFFSFLKISEVLFCFNSSVLVSFRILLNIHFVRVSNVNICLRD